MQVNRWEESSSGGSCPMYHFLFSFPRARAAPRQVSECVTVMVTMVLWKASSPGFWTCAPHQPLHPLPLLPNEWLLAPLLPRTSQSERTVECSVLAKMLPTLWFYQVEAKVSVGPCVWDGICLGDAMMEDVCVQPFLFIYLFFKQGMCCWAHRCFFQRWVSVEKSWEKEGSQVQVL